MRTIRQLAGFTLIELLIVVAIIAILAAIAVPNFLEAQVRAKTSRVRADLRSLSNAQEAYFVDYNSYTNCDHGDAMDYEEGFRQLTSPIAYITTIPRDPFGEYRYRGERRFPMLEMGTGRAGVGPSGTPTDPNPAGCPSDTWYMGSAGPDHQDDTENTHEGFNLATGNYPWANVPDNDQAVAAVLSLIYDPTNGTVSDGEIYRAGGTVPHGRPLYYFHVGGTGGK